MEAEARRQTAFAHRRGASSSEGGSRRGGFNSDAPNDRLSPAGACRGQCPHARAESSAGPSDTCSGRRQNPSGECLRLVRAYRTRALWAYVVRSRRPRQMVDYGSLEDNSLQRTCSTCKDPAGNGSSSAASGLLRLSHPPQSSRSRTIIWRSWIGATSGPGAVVSRVKAAPRSGMGRQSPAKQNQSSPAFVNFHFDFGDFLPVNSKKCDAGTRQRPTGKRLPSERKLMIGGPLGFAGGKPQRKTENSNEPSSRRLTTGAGSVGQMSSRGSRFGAADGHLTGMRVSLNAAR